MNKDEPNDKSSEAALDSASFDALDEIKRTKGSRNIKSAKTVGVSSLVCLLAALLTGAIGFAIGTRMPGVSINRPDYAELNEVYSVLSSKYDGKVDRAKLIQGAAIGMAAAAGDPYTSYLTTKEASDLSDELSGSFFGVGIEMSKNDDGLIEVVSVIDDSPAKKSGVMPKDIIYKINDSDATRLTTSAAASKIRGKAGTTVKLSLVRDGKPVDLNIKRARIDNPSVKWRIDNNIGYMRISQFGEDTDGLARKAAEEFRSRDVKGVVLDLRGNGGGYVDGARAVASLWLDDGSVVTREISSGKVRSSVEASGQNIMKDMPTVVLIDGGSASASEIVAGALKDYGVAKLVGVKSYGKGSVQELVTLRSGAKMKITVAKWYTPKGLNIDKTGIEPDKEVKMTAEQYNHGDDSQLKAAIDLLSK